MDDRIRAMMWAALGGRAGNDPTEHFAMAAKQAIEEVTGATMPRYSGSAADYLRMLGVEIDANNTRFRALVNLMMRWRQDATRPAQPDASRRFSLETHRAAAILEQLDLPRDAHAARGGAADDADQSSPWPYD